jgi:hypothetical protein
MVCQVLTLSVVVALTRVVADLLLIYRFIQSSSSGCKCMVQNIGLFQNVHGQYTNVKVYELSIYPILQHLS